MTRVARPITPACPFCRYDLSGAEAALRAPSRDAPPRDPSLEPLAIPSTDPSRADQPSVLPRPSGRGRCSECGQEFDWTDAYRTRNNYFDDLPRADLWSGFGRSLLVALFPWTSSKVESAARFRLRRTWLVTAVACAAWHALAAAWVMLMQSGWLSPWGVPFDRPLRLIFAVPWSAEWGRIISGAKNGPLTITTMGARGMLDPLAMVSVCWLVGVVLLGVVIAGRPKPNCGLLWARAMVRSIPAIGLLTLVMCAEWVIVSTIESRVSPSTAPTQGPPSIGEIAASLLLLALPVLVLFITWTRHVRDTGLFNRTWPIVAAMILVPIVGAIVMLAAQGAWSA